MAAIDQPETGSGVAVYKRLLQYALPYWRAFAVALLGMALLGLTEPLFAAMMKPLLDGSFVDRDPEVIRWMPLFLLLLFVLRATANFLGTYYLKWVGRKVVTELREEIFDHLLRLPARYYDSTSSGVLISKLIFNVDQVASAVTQALTYLVRDSVMVTGLLAWMLYLNPVLSLVFLILGPLLALSVRYVSKRFRRLSSHIQDAMGQITHAAQEVVDAHRVVKVFGGIESERSNFSRINERVRRQQMKKVATDVISVGITQTMLAGALALILYLSTVESMRSEVTVGTFMSFIMAMALLLAPVKRLTSVNIYVQGGIAGAQSIFALLDTDSERDTGHLQVPAVKGEIEYRGVSHTYDPGKGEVLHNVSFRVQPGQTVAFVGRSGSGKSTLMNLLPRFYDASEGQLLIDGRDIREFTLDSLRRQIAIVTQEVTLFNDTVARNIAYGASRDASREAIERAAHAAHAMEFIERFPKGLDTLVGQDGVKLSGGQRQRLAIARAILKDAPILILDEATSSLDTQAERHIQSALESLMAHRTTLVIAHRLSTIEKANYIIVLNDGRIVEQGTHAELLALEGQYAELHRLQFNEEAPDPGPGRC